MEALSVWGGEAVWTRRKHRRVVFAMKTQEMSENGSEQSDFLGAFKNTRLLGQWLLIDVWVLFFLVLLSVGSCLEDKCLNSTVCDPA